VYALSGGRQANTGSGTGVREASGDTRPPVRADIPNNQPDVSSRPRQRNDATAEMCGVGATGTAQTYRLYNKGKSQQVEMPFNLMPVSDRPSTYKMMNAQSGKVFGLDTPNANNGSRFEWVLDQNTPSQQFTVVQPVFCSLYKIRHKLL
jgi:hypothetical protein